MSVFDDLLTDVLAPLINGEDVVVIDATEEPTTVARVAKTFSRFVVVAKGDASAALCDVGLRPFALDAAPGWLFAASGPLAGARYVEAEATTVKQVVATVLKVDDEQRTVLGIVLEPDVVDSQKDTYDTATVRDAAWGYVEAFQNIGLQHQELINGKVRILESYLAPVAFELNGVAIKTGTWLMRVRVTDDTVWADVKAGKLTGFSIGGTAIRTPEPAVQSAAEAA